jgi:hypothetical protein
VTTPIYAFPYPVLTDPPNGAAQIQALAEAVEDTISTLDSSVSGDLSTLANPARAHLRTTAVQAIPNNSTGVAIEFDVEDFDTAGGHSTVTNNTRYTAQVAGTYLLAGGYGFATSGTGNRVSRWLLNGSTVDASTNITVSYTGNTGAFMARTIMIALAVNDYIELEVTQSSGGALNTSAAGCYMSVLLIRNNAL